MFWFTSAPPKEERVSNWSTDETTGQIIEKRVRLYYGDTEGIYEIDCDPSISHGLQFAKSTEGKAVIVEDIEKLEDNINVYTVSKKGDILVAINEREIFEDDPEDIFDLIEMLDIANLRLRMKLINPKKITLSTYIESNTYQVKTEKDMYGFTRTLQYVTNEKNILQSLSKNNHSRDIEWVEYLKSIGGPDNLKPACIYKPSTDLRYICRRGIPPAFRALVWTRISLANIYRQSYHETYYEELVLYSEQELEKKVIDEIEKDLKRTFPDHDYFENGDACHILRRILRSYALHNPSIGYCQSLNFIVGTMLLFLNEEDCFWLLATMIDQLLPKDYYSKSMIGVYVDQYVLIELLEKKLPKLCSHLNKYDIQLPLITLQWFLCLYVNTLTPEVTLRIWDIFLNEGNSVLFKVAIALFQLHEQEILNLSDSSMIFQKIIKIGSNIHDPELLIQKVFQYTTTDYLKSFYYQTKQFYINPRLNMYSNQGNVPRQLTGLGLAHLGPMKQQQSASPPPPPTSTSDSNTTNNMNVDDTPNIVNSTDTADKQTNDLDTISLKNTNTTTTTTAITTTSYNYSNKNDNTIHNTDHSDIIESSRSLPSNYNIDFLPRTTTTTTNYNNNDNNDNDNNNNTQQNNNNDNNDNNNTQQNNNNDNNDNNNNNTQQNNNNDNNNNNNNTQQNNSSTHISTYNTADDNNNTLIIDSSSSTRRSYEIIFQPTTSTTTHTSIEDISTTNISTSNTQNINIEETHVISPNGVNATSGTTGISKLFQSLPSPTTTTTATTEEEIMDTSENINDIHVYDNNDTHNDTDINVALVDETSKDASNVQLNGNMKQTSDNITTDIDDVAISINTIKRENIPSLCLQVNTSTNQTTTIPTTTTSVTSITKIPFSSSLNNETETNDTTVPTNTVSSSSLSSSNRMNSTTKDKSKKLSPRSILKAYSISPIKRRSCNQRHSSMILENNTNTITNTSWSSVFNPPAAVLDFSELDTLRAQIRPKIEQQFIDMESNRKQLINNHHITTKTLTMLETLPEWNQLDISQMNVKRSPEDRSNNNLIFSSRVNTSRRRASVRMSHYSSTTTTTSTPVLTERDNRIDTLNSARLMPLSPQDIASTFSHESTLTSPCTALTATSTHTSPRNSAHTPNNGTSYTTNSQSIHSSHILSALHIDQITESDSTPQDTNTHVSTLIPQFSARNIISYPVEEDNDSIKDSSNSNGSDHKSNNGNTDDKRNNGNTDDKSNNDQSDNNIVISQKYDDIKIAVLIPDTKEMVDGVDSTHIHTKSGNNHEEEKLVSSSISSDDIIVNQVNIEIHGAENSIDITTND